MFTQLFVASVLALSAQSVVATCSRSYTVQEGDYCDKISQAQNVSTYQLAAVNNNSINKACSNLLAGQTLCLAENANEDCSTTYVVRQDDTCDGIASRSGLNTTILTLNNPQIDDACSNIYVGEVLCTSKTVQVPPVPAAGIVVAAPTTTIVIAPHSTRPVTVKPASSAAVTPVVTPQPASSAAATPVVTPQPTASADDDEDCDDEETSTAVKPSATSAAAAKPSASSDAGDDEDDDDLPFCDEL